MSEEEEKKINTSNGSCDDIFKKINDVHKLKNKQTPHQ